MGLNAIRFALLCPKLDFSYRLGFLGMLHMEVFGQRLEQEHDMDTIMTAPSVSYKAELADGTEVAVDSPTDYPDPGKRSFVMHEPMVSTTLVFPEKCVPSLYRIVHTCHSTRSYSTAGAERGEGERGTAGAERKTWGMCVDTTVPTVLGRGFAGYFSAPAEPKKAQLF